MQFIKPLLLLSFLSISFSINKIYVYDIDFIGNKNIEKNELASFLRLKKKTFMKTVEFKSNKLNLDLIAIQSLYKSKGYLDVEIDYSYNYIDKNNVSIIFSIFEGVRYKTNNISIIGNKSFEDSYILELIQFDSDYYNPTYVRSQLLHLKNEYLKIGKINISITDEINKGNGLVDLSVYISEGDKFHIGNIMISGLERIDTSLVLRELVFDVGDLYNIDLINKTRSYLFESQLFTSIEIFPYFDTDTTITLDVRLRELRSREIEFEFGFSELPSNQGDLPVSAINTLVNYDRSNLFNSATKLSLKAEYGFSYSNDTKFLRSYYELGLYSPWFFNIRIPFRFKIYNENILFNTLVLGDKKTGIITYVENYRSSNPYLSAGLITDFFESNKNQKRSLYASYIKHNIENFINPSNGYYISINPRLNGAFLGGAYSYFKNDIELKFFRSIFNTIVFASRFKMGFIYDLKNVDKSYDDGVPNFDKFFLGGSSSLRGWTSPIDYNNEEGGLSRALMNFEVRVPIYKILGIEIFYDGGLIKSDISEVSLKVLDDFSWNIGWGIVIQSNLGPARIDFAYKKGTGSRTIQVSLLNMF